MEKAPPLTSPSSAYWPLFGLRVVTPRIEVRYVDDELAVALAELGARGVHDPATMCLSSDVDPRSVCGDRLGHRW